MDLRTTQVLAVLDSTAVELLAELHGSASSEKELLKRLPHINQSHMHKRLARLAKAGLIERPGWTGEKGKGVAWQLVAPEPTADLLNALLGLADSLDQHDRGRRRKLRERLKKEALPLKLVKGGKTRG